MASSHRPSNAGSIKDFLLDGLNVILWFAPNPPNQGAAWVIGRSLIAAALLIGPRRWRLGVLSSTRLVSGRSLSMNVLPMSALPPKADIAEHCCHVRFVP